MKLYNVWYKFQINIRRGLCGRGHRWNKIGKRFIIVEVGEVDMLAHYIIFPVYYMLRNFQNKYAFEKYKKNPVAKLEYLR